MKRQIKQTLRILYGENNILTNMEKELVWAKVPYWPPWPGRICIPRPHLMKVPAKPKRIKSKWIFFFGTKNYGWTKEKNLKPYVENRDHFVQNIRKSNFKEAVKRIDEYISDPVRYKLNAEDPEIESHKSNISMKPSTKKSSVKPKTKRTTCDFDESPNSKRKGRSPKEKLRYFERPTIKVKDEKSINGRIARQTRTVYSSKVCCENITRRNSTRAKTCDGLMAKKLVRIKSSDENDDFQDFEEKEDRNPPLQNQIASKSLYKHAQAHAPSQPKHVCKLSGIPRESGKNAPRVQSNAMPCFISEPMHDKHVSEIAGISKSLAKRLTKAGFEKAWSVLGQYLLLKKDSELFKGWLKIDFKASSKQAELCYRDLKDWCEEFL